MPEHKTETENQTPAGAETAAENTPPEAAEAAPEVSADEALAAAAAEIAKLRDERLRALAETENVRKRAARDRENAARYAIDSFAKDMLSVADNLRRALVAVDQAAVAGDPALQNLVKGVEMTEAELLTVFKRYGITPIESLGKPFDPHVHDAMFELPDESVPERTVVQVVEQGYMIHDRPLRPARVGVSRGGPKRPPAGAGEEPPSATGGATSAYEKQADQGGGASGSTVDKTL